MMSNDMKFLQEFHKIVLSYEHAMENLKSQNSINKKYKNKNSRQEDSKSMPKYEKPQEHYMIIDGKMSIQNAVLNDPIKSKKMQLK